MVLRPNRKPTRPQDEPIFTSPTGLDFEKRRLIVPPSFIDLAVLAGGDEYVKASDLAIIVNAFVEEMEKLRLELVEIRLHQRKLSNLNVHEEDVR